MHQSSYLEMALNIGRYFHRLPPKSTIIDIGSMDINGSYKALIEPPFKYIGVDLAPGNNVDRVMTSEFNTGLPDSFAAGAISGQCLEHCRNPFTLVKEIFRICRRGGYVLLTAPWTFQIHRYPVDCWRILPDGMETLIEYAGGIFVKSYTIDSDCWGIGQSK